MISIITVVEILLFCLGGILLIYSPKLRFSEIVASGIVIGFIIISCIFQAAFLIGRPNFSFAIEGLIITWIIFAAVKKRQALFTLVKNIKPFLIEEKIILGLLFVAWLYLALQATLLPPANFDSMTYNLARVLVFQQEKTLLLGNVEIVRQAMFPVGADILHHAFLRFYTDYGIAIFSFLAYIAVALGTYALSRRYTSTNIALTTTLVIVSLPEFVLQATSTKNDIFTVAVAIFGFLTIHRILDNLNLRDLYFLTLSLLFGISIKTTFAAFLIPFTLFFGILFIKKYELLTFIQLIFKNFIYLPILLVPAVIVSQIWLFIHNYFIWGNWAGPVDFVMFYQQSDGIKGCLANLVRYFFQSLDLSQLADFWSQRFLNLRISHELYKIYEILFNPFFGNAGIIQPISFNGIVQSISFNIEWHLDEDLSWFGPWGFLIVTPAVIWTAIKGNQSLKAASLTLLGCFLIICYQIVWMPWNNRFFSLFFASSSLCVAYFLNTFFHKKICIIFLRYTSILILLVTCIFNNTKPLLPLEFKSFDDINNYVKNESIWAKTNFGNNRLYYAEQYFGDSRLTQFPHLVHPGSKIAMVTDPNTWVYHYFLCNPQVKFTSVKLSALKATADKFDYILCLNLKCDLSSIDAANTLWKSTPPAKEGELIDISHSTAK